MENSTVPAPPSAKLAQVLISLPGVAALLLGGLYALGGLLTMADLRGAGLNVRDTLPLIPLEALLSRGIGTATTAAATLAALIGFAVVVERYTASSEHRGWWLLLAAMLFGGLGFGLLVAPVIVGLAIIGACAVFLILDVSPMPMRAQVAFAYLPIVLGLALQALLAPQPLPAVTIETAAGGSVKGTLVTVTSERWYVKGDNDHVRAVSNDQAESAELASGTATDVHKSVTELLGVPWWVIPAIVIVLLSGSAYQRWVRSERKRPPPAELGSRPN